MKAHQLALLLLPVLVAGHSWNYNPTPREYGLRPAEIDNEVVTEGCKYTRADGFALTYSKGGDLAMRKVSRGRELCVSWMANGHERDPGRGWVRLSLSAGNDTQREFDEGILLGNVDFAAFEGVRVPIPADTPLGLATLQFYWDYCGAHRVFVTCSDVEIVASDDPLGHGLGLRGNEQARYLGHCVDGMPPYPVGQFGVANNCPPLDDFEPAPSDGESESADESESELSEDEEEHHHCPECECDCDAVVTQWVCTSV